MAHRTAEELESQNDEHIEGLRAKVQVLKNVTNPLFSPFPSLHFSEFIAGNNRYRE